MTDDPAEDGLDIPSEAPAALDPPPPLTAIRIRGARAKGLNKAAILIAAGGFCAIILVLA